MSPRPAAGRSPRSPSSPSKSLLKYPVLPAHASHACRRHNCRRLHHRDRRHKRPLQPWQPRKQHQHHHHHRRAEPQHQPSLPGTTVWVMVPVVTQEDQYYLRSREDLIQLEDARYRSLISAVANFYTTRNDQSLWGAFIRAIAMELARIEYMYSYDIVAKNPVYLTPPDIKREYADPLFVTGTFQQQTQFDMGDFGAEGAGFLVWAGNTGFIANAVIVDSNGNLQVATTPGATASSQPSWSLELGGITTDGSVVWTNYGQAPSPLAYPVGYRDMLVDLLSAYQEGATAKSVQDVIYAYTGKNIIVEELYKQITTGGFYDQSDRNAIAVSVNVGGDDPLTDIQSLAELQQITNSLYTAIDLAKPAHVGLEFTTVFGAFGDENVNCFISPRYLTQYQLATLPAAQAAYYSLIAYTLTTQIYQGWIATTNFPAGTIIQDSNGNVQLTLVGGVSGTIKPTWNPTLQGTTEDGLSSPPTSPPSYLVWINIGTPEITIAAYAALPISQQPYYQSYYQNLNCVGTGIDDTLEILIQQVEEPPFDPMLYQAPTFDPANPTTTLAAYGRRVLTPIMVSSWQQLNASPTVWDTTVTYPKGTLVRGRYWGEDGSFNAGVWTPGGWQLYRAKKKSTGQDPIGDTNQTYWTPLSSPSIYQAYYLAQNGLYVAGIRQWAPSTNFYTGQLMIDNNGSLQIANSGSSPQSPPQSPPSPGLTSPVATVATTFDAVSISNNLLTLVVNSTAGMGLVNDVSLITLLGFSFATFLNGLTLPVVAFSGSSIIMTLVHADYNSETQLEGSATARIGFSQSKTVPTYDGTIVWQCFGSNPYTDPSKWIAVVDSTNNVTGEVANWDVTHPMGLLAPRTDLCWEISGGDFFSSYEE